MAATSGLAALVNRRDLDGLARALVRLRGPVPAQALVAAAGLAWKAGLALLVKHGGSLDATHRNYRPLHALLQGEPPARGGPSERSRLACLKWMLGRGADPEIPGAWPAMRALVVAAFAGRAADVAVLREAGARIDGFTGAALGEAGVVGAHLARDPGFARARDGGKLTALQACAGSRLGLGDARVARGLMRCARLLVDAGADPNARTRTFGGEVDVASFAVRSGQVPMLEFLLDRGLDATAALVPAAREGRADVLDLLLARGAKLDEARVGTRPLLNELVRWGRFAEARLILARGASPDLADDRGWTAIHQAVSRGNARMLADLLSARRDFGTVPGTQPQSRSSGREPIRRRSGTRGEGT